MKQVVRPQSVVRKERSFISVFGLLAFFLGAFLAVYDVLVHVLFLESFGYKYLASSFIAAGITGAIISYVYSIIYRKIEIKKLNVFIFTFILLSVGAYLIQIVINPSKVNTYMGMVMLFPLNSFSVFLLWRIGRKLLTKAQSKENISKMRVFHLFGWAVGGGSVSLAVSRGVGFAQISIIALIALLLIWGLQLVLFRIHANHPQVYGNKKDAFVPVSKSVVLFFTSKFSSALYLFCLLSAIAMISVHYVFINVAVVGFQSVIGLAKFYGLFIAVLMVFTFGVDKFLIRKILYSYDSPYSLIIAPISILLLVSVAGGGFYFASKYQPHEHFTLYFLLLVIAKVGVESMRTIVQIPSLRVLFQSMDIRYRQVVYPRIEVSAVLLGIGIAGVVILPMSFLSFFNLNVVLVFVVVVAILWGASGVWLLKLYHKNQKKQLDRLKFSKTGTISEAVLSEKIWGSLTGNEVVKVDHILNVLSEVRPDLYESYLSGLLEHHREEVRNSVIKRVLNDRIVELLPELENKAELVEPPEREQLLHAVRDIQANSYHNKSTEDLKEVIFSGDVKARMQLVDMLSGKRDEQSETLLIELSKDIDAGVQNAALKYLARHDSPHFDHTILNYLYPKSYSPYAITILSKTGGEALDSLEREQALPNVPQIVQNRIYRIYTLIGNRRSIENVLSNIGNLDQNTLSLVLQSLIDVQYKVDDKNKYKLFSLIVKQVGVIAKNLNFYHILSKDKRYSLLAESYREELTYNYDLLFKLMSIVYHTNIISSFRAICMEGSYSQVYHGIELVDQYLDDELKPLIFPLIENVGVAERIKRLEQYFLPAKLTAKNVLENSLTADYNSLSLYPRVCAMLHIYQQDLVEYQDELVFNSYHSEPLLSETALFILYHKFKNVFEGLKNEDGMSKARRLEIEQVELLDEEELRCFKFSAIRHYDVFSNLSEQILLRLVDSARRILLDDKGVLYLNEHNEASGMLLTNSTEILGNNKYSVRTFKNLLNINVLLRSGITELKLDEEADVWLLTSDDCTQLMYDHIEMLDLYMDVVEKVKWEEEQ